MEEIKNEDELVAKARAGKLVEKVEKPPTPPKGPGIRTFHVYVEEDYYKVEVETEGGACAPTAVAPRMARGVAPRVIRAPAPTLAPPSPKVEAPPKPVEKKEELQAVAVSVGETAVTAPMPGMVIRYEVNVGDQVKAGDTVMILEAMKMETPITSPIDGIVKTITHKKGDNVGKDKVVAIIAPA